jgi:hypothetical protein
MAVTSDELIRRWRTMRHIGAYKPTQVVRVRTGRFNRGFDVWGGMPVGAAVPGETKANPWQATWTPASAWKELPGVSECRIEQAFDSNGIATTTLTLQNTLMAAGVGNMGMVYHAIQRGAMSPYLGYNAPGTAPWDVPPNEWFNLLTKDAQIWIQQGYGGDIMADTFTGLIDDVDPQTPGTLVLTCRDFGKVLAEERLFGWVDGPKVIDPVIFTAKANALGPSDPVGFNADASTTRDGYPARLVTTTDDSTKWISHDHTTNDNTEWVEVRLPAGKYESFLVHPAYAGMTMYVGVYAHDDMLGGENSQVDDVDIPVGWVRVPDAEGGGVVPGDNGGWPYILKFDHIADTKKSYRLGYKLDLGANSVLRVGFRNLYKISTNTYRASAARLAGNKQKSDRNIILRLVAKDAEASTERDGYPASMVIDETTSTGWISHDHTTPDNTEWVEIHVPQGRYDSFQIHTDYGHLDMFVSVYAHNRKRKKKTGGYEDIPCQVDDVDQPLGGHWIDMGYGDVPGDNGGVPLFVRYPDVGPQPKGQPEKYRFGHKLELGDGSVIRVHFRNLFKINDKYRASVNKLKAYTRTGVKQPDVEKPVAKIEVEDASDIIRVILRWAGFKEWEIENTGVKLKGDWVFNRQTYLIDVIKKVQEATGFIFYIGGPSADDHSIGVPVFRSSYLLRDDIQDMPTVRDKDMITAVQAKLSDEPLGYIIRVRGAASDAGKQLGADKTKKLMSVYKPPWHTRMGGILKHVVEEWPRLADQLSVDVAARLIAVQQALASATATMEIPGHPGFELDGQVGMWDTDTGLKTRLYIARTASTFIQGKQASWKTEVGGSLLDTPDIVDAKRDLFTLVPAGTGIPQVGNELTTK